MTDSHVRERCSEFRRCNFLCSSAIPSIRTRETLRQLLCLWPRPRGRTARTLLHAIQNSRYFDFCPRCRPKRRHKLLGAWRVQLSSVRELSRQLSRGSSVILVETVATNPGATGMPGYLLRTLVNSALKRPKGWHFWRPGPIDLRVRALQPEGHPAYSIVPGGGEVLTMTMVMITGNDRRGSRAWHDGGTCSMPTRPPKLIGKIVLTSRRLHPGH